MTLLFTVDELLAATGGRPVDVTAEGVSAISIDSRDLPQGSLFVAIRGDSFDGHDFVPSALGSGAALALVSEARAEGLGGNLIVVPDALAGLGDIAGAARKRARAAVVAVTGSVGKTTTKEALRAVLGQAGDVHASIKSFNNHWGVPLSLSRLPREADFGVFEIGMNHAGEITPLTRLVRPNVAVITAIAPAHLAFFDSVADIARAKAEIFLGLEPGGTAIINADHDYLDILVAAARDAGAETILTYGYGEGVDWRISEAVSHAEHMMASIDGPAGRIGLVLGVKGRHMVSNAVAALIVGEVLGVDRKASLSALADFIPPEGRGQSITLGSAESRLLLIDESYNANTASMKAALEVFGDTQAPAGRRIVVLGEMRELGERSRELHAGLASAVEAARPDAVYLVGPDMQALAERLSVNLVTGVADSIEGLEDSILNDLAYGDAIMVKGSNGVRLSGLVKKIRQKFQ